jgi:hypothetical protein
MNRVEAWFLASLLAAAAPGAIAQSAPTQGVAAPALPATATPESSTDATPPRPAAATTPAAPASKPPSKSGARAPGSSRAMDRLDLDATQITGNRELPKVMVVVPWKKSDIGDLVGKPINSLVDEALQPVDREVFRREVDYYGALAPDRPAAAAAGPPATEAPPR